MSNKLENMLELAKELREVDAAPESLVNDLEKKNALLAPEMNDLAIFFCFICLTRNMRII